MKRIKWIDFVKGVLILMVVLGHCIQASGRPLDGTMLIRCIKTLQMPLFMLVSGYVLYSQELSLRKLRKKMVRLLVPFLSWAVFFSAWKCIETGQISSFYAELLSMIIRPDRALWFLWALAVCILFVFLIRWLSIKLRMNELALDVIVACLMMAFVALTRFDRLGVQFVAEYFPFVLLGYYMRVFWGGVKKGPVLTIALAMLCVYLVLLVYWRWKSTIVLPLGVVLSGSLSEMYGFLVSIVGSTGIILCCLLFPDMRFYSNKYMVTLGQMTLGIYAVHQFILYRISSLTSASGLDSVPVWFLMTLIASVGVVMLIRRNKVLALLLLGEYQETK